MDCSLYQLGDVRLQKGENLPDARIAYKTHGSLNADRTNAIVFPTWFTGGHRDVEWVIGPGRALDPAKYFIVVVNIVGNGMSSSPSNQAALLDNAMLQRRLLREKFGIERLRLVVGRSMGAQIAFQWGSYFADEVQAILALEGSARTSAHNYVFLATMKMALQSAVGHDAGERAKLAVQRMRLVADSWGFSQTWYRKRGYEKLGFRSVDEFLHRPLPEPVGDINDFLAQIRTWENADISDNDRLETDFAAALKAITAKAIVMPSASDLYFPPEDSEIEVAMMPNAELRIMPTVWGHRAGSPGTDPADIQFFERAIADLLSG
jgi:homoserine O-acetyltransferase